MYRALERGRAALRPDSNCPSASGLQGTFKKYKYYALVGWFFKVYFLDSEFYILGVLPLLWFFIRTLQKFSSMPKIVKKVAIQQYYGS